MIYSIFQGFNKKGLSIKGKQVINSNISYRPPILSLDLSYFKGFNFNSLDAISEGFKTKICNQEPDQRKQEFHPPNYQVKGFGQQNMMYAAQYPQMSFENYAAYQQPPPNQLQFQNFTQYNMGFGGQYNYPQNSYYGFAPVNYNMNPGMAGFGVPPYPCQMNMQTMGIDYNAQFYTPQEPSGYGGFGIPDYSMMQGTYQTNISNVGQNNNQQFETAGSDKFCVPPQLETIGDPHPSLFRSLNPPAKTQPRKDLEESVNVGSWDPKFLQKSGIRKFRHNEGQKYKEGFVMNKHVVNNASHKFQKYDPFQAQAQTNVIQEDEKSNMNMIPGGFKNRKPDNKQKNFQNIFTQTFGTFDQNPPKTAKFDTFKKNLKKGKHYDQNNQDGPNSTFSGTNFSDTFKMYGPMKTSRPNQKEQLITDQDSFSLKKGKSNFCEDLNKDKQMFSEDENNMSQDKIKLGSSKQISYQQHNTKFGIINESEQNDESMGNEDENFTSNFMSCHIPIMQGFEFENDNEGFGNFPSYTPVANANKSKTIIGTQEDRNSKGIAGLLELAGTKYQLDQEE